MLDCWCAQRQAGAEQMLQTFDCMQPVQSSRQNACVVCGMLLPGGPEEAIGALLEPGCFTTIISFLVFLWSTATVSNNPELMRMVCLPVLYIRM